MLIKFCNLLIEQISTQLKLRSLIDYQRIFREAIINLKLIFQEIIMKIYLIFIFLMISMSSQYPPKLVIFRASMREFLVNVAEVIKGVMMQVNLAIHNKKKQKD